MAGGSAILASAASAADGAARPDLDRLVLNRAIMAGVLELLPQSPATMALVTVQLKTVAYVGKAHGFALDPGSVRELLAIAGVGLTDQVLESYARKLIGGALRGIAGTTAGALGETGTSAVNTLATHQGDVQRQAATPAANVDAERISRPLVHATGRRRRGTGSGGSHGRG